jgi:hypothetical protein
LKLELPRILFNLFFQHNLCLCKDGDWATVVEYPLVKVRFSDDIFSFLHSKRLLLMNALVGEKLAWTERMLSFRGKFVIGWFHFRQFQLELMQLWE